MEDDKADDEDKAEPEDAEGENAPVGEGRYKEEWGKKWDVWSGKVKLADK